MTLTNADAMNGAGDDAGRLYRELVANAGSHDALCDAYGLDRDDVNGGTYWRDVLRQAVRHGDIDTETWQLT